MIRPKQLWYLPVLAAAVGMMMLRLLAMAQVLELAEFGRYSAGLLVSTTFCMLGCAGLQSLLQRDMPIMAARGRLLRPLVLTMQALLVACACAAFLLAVPAAGGELAGLKAGVLAVAILHGLSQQVFLVVTVESRSLGEPVRYAAQNLWRALAVVAAGAAAAMSTGSATWTLACEAAVTLVVSFAIVREIARRFGTRLGALAGLAQRRWRQVDWSAASVFLAISVVSSVAATVDRWFAASLLDVAEFALYAFAGIVLLVAQSAQAMINAAVFPALARRHALQGSRAAFASSARVSLALAAAGVVLCVPAYFLIDSAVQRWYPAYAGGLAILRSCWPRASCGFRISGPASS